MILIKMSKIVVIYISIILGISTLVSGLVIPEFNIMDSNYIVANSRFEAVFNGGNNAITFKGPNNDLIIFEAKRTYFRDDTDEILIGNVQKSEKILRNSKSLSFSDNLLLNTETVYTPIENGIKFHLIIQEFSSLPSLPNLIQAETAALDMDFELQIPDNLHIAVNGHYWDKQSEVETTGDIVFYREGVPRLYLLKSFGLDAEDDKKEFSYKLWTTETKTYLTLKLDYDWLSQAKYPVVIDPSAISGCTETDDLVNCSFDTYIGHWIDSAKSILIESATINSIGYVGLNGQVRLNSTNGTITIKDSTILAYGMPGSPSQSGGSGACYLYGNNQNDIVIRNSKLNCYGGKGGDSDGPDADPGGNGNFRVISGENLDINNTQINAYGGNGGDAYDCGNDNGGNAGTGNVLINISYNIAVRENNTFQYYNGQDGACGPGNPTGTGYGRFYSTSGHIAFGNGTWLKSNGGSGSFKNIYITDKLTFADTVNVTTKSNAINNITILSGGDNKLGLFNTNIPLEHKIHCTGTLSIGRSGREDQNLNFTGCSTHQNITKSAYGEIDWLWGDGTGLAPPVLSNFVCGSCSPVNESPYSTSDTTPTFSFDTDLNAWCRISNDNLNYSAMTNSRDCESGENTQSHTCTLPMEDELIYQTDYVYVSCRELYNNDNTSTLQMSLSGLEETSDTAIINGIISSSVWPGAIIYDSIEVYIGSSDNHAVGNFDKVTSYRNKRWAFNYVTENETSIGTFYNLTPSFYFLELTNLSGYDITNKVSQYLNETI